MQVVFWAFLLLPVVVQGQASSIQLRYDVSGFGTYRDKGVLHYHEGNAVFFVKDTFSVKYREKAIAKKREFDEKIRKLPKTPEGIMQAWLLISSQEPIQPKWKEFPSSFIQTDLNNSVRLSRKKYGSLEETYVLKEKTGGIRWRLKSEKRVILGFDCQKAKGKFGGRSYTVWYTPQIPISVGPWKLEGLPGAIVEGSEDTNRIAFRLSEIQYDLPRPKVPVLNPKPEEIISCKESFRLQKREQQVIMEEIMALSSENIKVSTSSITFDPLQKKCK